MAFTEFRMVLTVLNLIGSLSSFVGASFIAVCYLILPMKRHFRHALILNLAIADMINGLTLAISGMYIAIKREDLSPGVPCTVNGFITQLSVQGTDCCILAITLVTFFSITKGSLLHSANSSSHLRVLLICASCWIMPVTTSIIALALKKYAPVSGNWCWIIDKPRYLRYVLTHGWRFLIIFTCIGLYVYLHFYLKKHFANIAQYSRQLQSTERKQPRRLRTASKKPSTLASAQDGDAIQRLQSQSNDDVPVYPPDKPTSTPNTNFSTEANGKEKQYVNLSMNPFAHRQTFDDEDNSEDEDVKDEEEMRLGRDFLVNVADEYSVNAHAPQEFPSAHIHPAEHRKQSAPAVTGPHNVHLNRKKSGASGAGYGNSTTIYSHSTSGTGSQHSSGRTDTSVRLTLKRINRVLLMNAYPAAYIILWIPGLCNRLVEASGHKSKVLQVMQASTQFVGLANAITYGWNERIAVQMRRRLLGS